MLRQFMFVATVFASSLGIAETLGFWDFRDGEPGTDVSTVANSAGTASYTSATAQKSNGNTGVLPKFNADSPGRIRDGLGGPVLCENPQSIDFRYVSRSNRQGGYIDLDGVADDISGKGSFTIEYFVKQNADYSYYETGDGGYDQRSKTMLYLESRTDRGAFKQIMPYEVVQATKKCKGAYLEVYAHSPVAAKTFGIGADLCDNKWHHVAIVYTETDAPAKTGKIALYWDQAKVNEHDYLNDPEGSTGLKLRIGTGYKDAGGNAKAGTESVNASISALRVSNVALTESQFLYEPGIYEVDPSCTIALLTLEGKTVGESATAFALDASDVEGVSEATGSAMTCDSSADKGVVPLYDADVPGKYLFSSRDRSEILSSDWRSLKFTTAGAPTSKASSASLSVGGGLVTFANLSSALSAQTNYTLEMFVKDEDWSEFIYARGVFAYDSLADAGTPQRNSYELSTSYAGSTSWNAALWAGVGNTICSKVDQAKSMTWKDGIWHHVAVVYNGELKQATTYIDYVAGTPKAYTNAYLGDVGYPLYLGASRCSSAPTKTTIPRNNYCFRGKVAGLRIVPRMLDVVDFMVADDSLEPSSTIFALNFEEGRNKLGAKISEKGNVPQDPYSAYTYGWAYKFIDSTRPEWSDKVSNKKIVKWGDAVAHTNETSLRLCGLHSVTEAEKTAQGNLTGYAGTVLARFGSDNALLGQNPKNWTMEGFFKMEYTDETISMPSGGSQTWNYPWSFFGKAGCPTAHASGNKKTPQISWGLTVSPTVRSWCLTWTEDDGKVDPASEATGTGGVSHSKTFEGTAEVLDKRWHHIAVTYDADKGQFELFVDHLSKGTATTGTNGPLWDGPYDFCFGRGVGGQTNLEGWMDEIRFSNKVLAPAEMVHLESDSGLIIFVR